MKIKLKIYLLFYIGHIIYQLCRILPNSEFLFNAYQYCILTSGDIQEEHQLTRPWELIPSEENYFKYTHELHAYYFSDNFEHEDFDSYDQKRIKFLQNQIFNFTKHSEG